MEKWKKKVQSTMRCTIGAIFSGIKRRFGEFFLVLKKDLEELRMVMYYFMECINLSEVKAFTKLNYI